MLKLERLHSVNGERDLLTCLRDGFQQIAERLQNNRPCLAMVPQKNSFHVGKIHHMHPNPELIISCVGHGTLDLFDGEFSFAPNRLVVTPRGITHFEHAKNKRVTYANIIVGCSSKFLTSHVRITRPGQKNNHISNRIKINDQRMHRVVRYLNESSTAHGDLEHPALPVSIGLCLAASAVLLEIIDDSLENKKPSDEDKDHLINLASAYVEEHFTNAQLRISDIARSLGCSADYLSHRFHQLNGQHLSRRITEQRLLFACTLLRESNLGIEEVARASGFQDPGYFSRCFRKAEGLSPRAWRKSLS